MSTLRKSGYLVEGQVQCNSLSPGWSSIVRISGGAPTNEHQYNYTLFSRARLQDLLGAGNQRIFEILCKTSG